jgi:ribA/ribD-fused uncharacterized protein
MTTNEIEKYYFFFGRFNVFSNWNMTGFSYKNYKFCCNEQFLMYCKACLFGDSAIADKILRSEDPAEHKRLGRLVKCFDEKLWASKREHYMYTGLMAKFSQNQPAYFQLMTTGDLTLVEAARYDSVWGVGLAESDPLIKDPKNWRGLNLLGKSLMRVRAELKANNEDRLQAMG